tara:strand:+ start:693 stop:1718 length:1026 start_codon:yes stop_codon:yes gene_type:complete
MAKRDILKEAIADAKTVKETAIANAKAALEEVFTPRLKEMLATKLEEMDLDEEEELKEKKYKQDNRIDDKIEDKVEDMRESENIDEEINLDEILAEIELDEENKDEIKEDEATDKEEEGYIDGEEDADKDKDEEEFDLEDMSDDDLKDFIEDVIADMVASGDLEAGENFEEEDEMEVVDDEEIVDVEVSEEMKDETVKETELEEVKAEDSLEEAKKEEDEKKKKMEEELKEAYLTIETLKSDLNEVNLLNGKLLYTNKIFKAKNLTESQKVKVLGAFDKAGTIKETKLVFETLNEGLKTKKSPIKESLGTASKVTGNVNAKKPIIETDPMVARFQKLAGLK